jgi:hypothetical protein
LSGVPGVSFASFAMSAADLGLIVSVTAMACAVAYLRQPRLKAFLISIPLPFTLAMLASSRPVDITHVAALLNLMMFAHVVRWLYLSWRIVIGASIVLAALAYVGLGLLMTHTAPTHALAFWGALAATAVISAAVLAMMPPRVEPEHRTPLPLWLKLPMVLAMVVFLVLIKQQLAGFIATFPYVAAYEGRKSLWTMSRATTRVSLAFCGCYPVIRLLEPHLGRPLALGLGLCGYAMAMALVRWGERRFWVRDSEMQID